MSYLKDMIRFKDLLYYLTLKELKLKYKNSILGIAWSLFNPLMMIIIYTLAFKMIMRIQIENYSLFVFAGLLPWTFFQVSVSQASTSIINHGSLVGKVSFPRAILPLSIILSNFINFLFTLLILAGAMIYFEVPFTATILLLPLLLIFLLMFVVGLGLLICALNTRFRDISYLMEVIFSAWFYLTPVIYSLSLVPKFMKPYMLANPFTSYIEAMRFVVIDGKVPPFLNILIIIFSSVASLLIGFIVFKKRERFFVDEL